jgi:hypothetical protein
VRRAHDLGRARFVVLQDGKRARDRAGIPRASALELTIR